METHPSTKEMEQEKPFEEEGADLEDIHESVEMPQPSLKSEIFLKGMMTLFHQLL